MFNYSDGVAELSSGPRATLFCKHFFMYSWRRASLVLRDRLPFAPRFKPLMFAFADGVALEAGVVMMTLWRTNAPALRREGVPNYSRAYFCDSGKSFPGVFIPLASVCGLVIDGSLSIWPSTPVILLTRLVLTLPSRSLMLRYTDVFTEVGLLLMLKATAGALPVLAASAPLPSCEKLNDSMELERESS
jgi:hypothetical protein